MPKEPIQGRPSKARRKELKKQHLEDEKKEQPVVVLSRLVELKIKRLLESRHLDYEESVSRLKLWLESKVIEKLPNGIIYKVADKFLLNLTGGLFVVSSELGYFNYPLIVVSARFTPTERRAIAMHEFVEWSKRRNLSGKQLAEHLRILSNDESKLRRGEKRVFPNLVSVYKEPHDVALRQENPRIRKQIIAKFDKMV